MTRAHELTPDQASIRLPAKVTVTLRAGAVLAVANILCVVIFAYAWTRVKADPKTIQVTGSARKAIYSDLIVWSCKVSAIDADLTRAYELLKASTDKTLAHLKAQGIDEQQITTSAVGTWKRRARDEKGNETEKIVTYELWQDIQVSSGDVLRVAEIARQITGLIKDGVVIESNPPTYIYTKLADLKIAMLADATRDAATRAQQIAANSGAELGAIVDARMGVMQINPVHSYEASGSGQSDTSSYGKEITAVVSARFGLR
jgi:hypothetical protein